MMASAGNNSNNPANRTTRSNSSATSPPKPTTILNTNGTSPPRKLSLTKDDPRASAYSISSSSSSSSSSSGASDPRSSTSSIDGRLSTLSSLDPRLSYLSSTSVEHEEEDVEDEDTLDDDVWVSRRFTMLLSPDAIKAFNKLPAFDRTTFHHAPTAPQQRIPGPTATQQPPLQQPNRPQPIPTHKTPQKKPDSEEKLGHVASSPHKPAALSNTPTSNSKPPIVSPRTTAIPPSSRHAQSIPAANLQGTTPPSTTSPREESPITSPTATTTPRSASLNVSAVSSPTVQKAKPPATAPRGNSTRALPSPTTPGRTSVTPPASSPATSPETSPTTPTSPTNPSFPASQAAAPVTLAPIPTTPLPPTPNTTPAPTSTPEDNKKSRVQHVPPKKPLPPNPKKAPPGPPRVYTKDDQEKAARIIQNHYKLYIGRKKHLQAVAIYKFRTHIANEILNTEKSYVSVLKHVVTKYYEPLIKNMGAIGVENDDVKIIFGGLPVLLNVNSNLLKDLESRMDSWSSTQCLGDLFLNMSPYLKTYTEYVKNFDTALRRIVKCSKNPQFEAFLGTAEGEDDGNKRTSLESYLITPVQRIPRYVLLLQQLHEHTPTNHVDKASLGKALNQIRDVASYINEKKREADNALRVVEIQSLLTGKGIPNLVNAQRRFCQEGGVIIHLKGGKLKKKRFLFLFNDILTLTKPTIVQTIFTKKQKYRFKFYVTLNGAEVAESPDNTFTLTVNGTSWVFGVDTPEIRNQWVNAIKHNIETLRSTASNFEERVSKITSQKASNARAAITKQYTTLQYLGASNSKLSSSTNLKETTSPPMAATPAPATPATPVQTSPTTSASASLTPSGSKSSLPYLELDDKEMAVQFQEIEGSTQKRHLTDVISRLLRASNGKNAKMPVVDAASERANSAPHLPQNNNGKPELKRTKSMVDVMTSKRKLLDELLEKVLPVR